MIDIHALQKTTEKTLVITLAVILIGVSALYAYFVNETVSNVVIRQQMEKEMSSLNSKVSQLEYKFIKKQNKITLDYAREIGFNEVENPSYVIKGETRTLTFRDDR